MSVEVNGLFWNLMMPVWPWLKPIGQVERAKRVPAAVKHLEQRVLEGGSGRKGARHHHHNHRSSRPDKELDFVGFCELVPDSCVQPITRGLAKQGFTSHVYLSGGGAVHCNLVGSGIHLYSRRRVLDQHNLIFRDGVHSDWFMCKGALHVKLEARQHAAPVHVIVTHLQAWDDEKAQDVRLKQWKQLRGWLSRLALPPNEPVVLLGDLNVTPNDAKFWKESGFDAPQFHTESPVYTWNPIHNELVGLDSPQHYGCEESYMASGHCWCCERQWLDYVLTSQEHAKPSGHSWVRALPIKAPTPFRINFGSLNRTREVQALSDHDPVWGRLLFH